MTNDVHYTVKVIPANGNLPIDHICIKTPSKQSEASSVLSTFVTYYETLFKVTFHPTRLCRNALLSCYTDKLDIH